MTECERFSSASGSGPAAASGRAVGYPSEGSRPSPAGSLAGGCALLSRRRKCTKRPMASRAGEIPYAIYKPMACLLVSGRLGD
jgi:hypothetical protein